jgi:hypothetical protein
MSKTKVLLVGECAGPHSHITQRLVNWDADCQFANSYSEACELFKRHAFRLVIGGAKRNDDLVSLVPLLEGSPTTLFRSYPIEDSCLWIRVVDNGNVCWDAPALRPGDFARLLRQVLHSERC